MTRMPPPVRRLLIPFVALSVGLSSTLFKKALLVAMIGVGVPVAGHQFVQAIMTARTQAVKRAEEHQAANRANRFCDTPDDPHDMISDLRASLIVAAQMRDRNDPVGARQSLRESTRVLQRAETQSRDFKTRLAVDQTVSDDEIHDMERIDAMSEDLRGLRRKLMGVGG